jgi:ring-1,2-phenylacetyl-CoA epoxidase subunit PaaD
VNPVVSEEQVLAWLDCVPDPEIPVLSITELGIVREVQIDDSVRVALAPTYSGCPATEIIERTVLDTLRDHGIVDATVERRLSPPWTTDWISQSGREKLAAYGIAPPAGSSGRFAVAGANRPAACPHCGSIATARVSEFGSTPCKAAWRCNDCREPFEYFKCI